MYLGICISLIIVLAFRCDWGEPLYRQLGKLVRTEALRNDQHTQCNGLRQFRKLKVPRILLGLDTLARTHRN